MRQSLRQWDHTTTMMLRGKPEWLRPLMLIITTLGSPWVIAPVTLAIAGLQLLSGDKKLGLALLLACVASMLNALLKFVPRRVRPDTPYVQEMHFKTYSFPSDHAFSAVVIIGLVAYCASVYLPLGLGAVVSVGLVGLALAIGFSRVYLGAHYVLDVLGGWSLGGLVLALLINFLAS